ncbi:MAG: lysylphosphatidylglycerol synthase transmembrane domain-containing protein [Bacteroidales bacterium]|nr:lysylphosphatidylglycerol synthase transmembrane domain-containing protein [Bacteroidales bacterium]
MSEELESRRKFKALQGWRLFIPVVLGLGVVVYLFWGEFNYTDFQNISLVKYGFLWFFCAIIMMFLRDLGYVIRLRIISSSQLSWRQCIRIIFLWEFTSAVTPSAIGGTTFAVIYIYKEQISIGKSSAIVMLTSFLDEFYFLIMFPIIVLSVNFSDLFQITQVSGNDEWGHSLMFFAIAGYSLKVLFAGLVFYGLFINPHGVKRLLFRLSYISFLRKWRRKMVRIGSDIMLASIEFKDKSWKFWLKTLLTTFLSWTSRYWVINFLFTMFFFVSFSDHFMIFARQLAMWIMMIALPSPGGSGFSEIIFSQYLGGFIPYAFLIPVLALLWRGITYYPYLLIGVFLLPAWIKKKFGGN